MVNTFYPYGYNIFSTYILSGLLVSFHATVLIFLISVTVLQSTSFAALHPRREPKLIATFRHRFSFYWPIYCITNLKQPLEDGFVNTFREPNVFLAWPGQEAVYA